MINLSQFLRTGDYKPVQTTGLIDLSLGYLFLVSRTENRTISFSNVTPGVAAVVVVHIVGTTGVISWPATINWSGGTVPATGAAWTTVALLFDGTDWYGYPSGGN